MIWMRGLFYFRTQWKYLGKWALHIFRFSAGRGGDGNISVRAAIPFSDEQHHFISGSKPRREGQWTKS
jgi:hypothetical protein